MRKQQKDSEPKSKKAVVPWKDRILSFGKKKASEFTANPNNPRTHPKKQRKAVKGSLESLGWIDVVIENKRTGYLIDGHERIWQALDHGDAEVPYILVDLSPEEEAQALLSLDFMANMAQTDKSMVENLLSQFNTENQAIQQFLSELAEAAGLLDKYRDPVDAEPATDRAMELNKKWQVAPGDLWVIGNHLLLCGDSTNEKDVARVLSGDRPSLMVTDPPYGVEYNAVWHETAGLNGPAAAKGTVTNDNRSKWCGAYIRANAPVAYVWHAGVHTAEVAMDLISAGYQIRSQIIWAKTKFVISRGDYHWGHEPCWYAVKTGEPGGFRGGRKQSTLWADVTDNFKPGARELYASKIDEKNLYAFPGDMTTLWTLKQDKMVDGGHSTQKPLECMARPIRNHGERGDVVFDPFGGTGTTMVAAENLERQARLIEISPPYCAVILERMTNLFHVEPYRRTGKGKK